MRKFKEVYLNTPAQPANASIVQMCQCNPALVSLEILVGQYKGCVDARNKAILRSILVKLSSEVELKELEE